jgi:hypothetical protein
MQAILLAALRAVPSAGIKWMLPLLERLITTGVIERIFWWAAEALVKRTDSPFDDELVAKLRETAAGK